MSTATAVWPPDLLPPPFADGARPALLDVLPPLLENPAPGRDVVVLLDGVGADLLAEHRALTPTLRRLEAEIARVRTVAPSTTSSAMVSLHTGRPPLEHGVLGHLTRDPRSGRALNQLTGAPEIDPKQWMPLPTPVEVGGRRAVQVAPAKHAGSHLSGVAFRGWDFLAHGRGDRVEAVRTALHRAGPEGLVHLHVDDVDHAGHRHGIDSEPWRTALAEVDALLGTLLRRLPRGTRLHVTADHGMVDTAPERTVDLAAHPRLLRLVEEVAGEPRALALHAVPGDGAAEELAEGLEALLAERALVLRRDEVLRCGLLGPAGSAVEERVARRLPDVLVLARGGWSVEDCSRRRADAHPMIGVHGSLTAAEAWVPLLRIAV
ncbi:alkaline phosphatase family protein [Brachybacterium saurashtrense]|uniref:Alkaline phosphatase family protein n=1 Tax=Brachybacterium saurashtrense TaxID=556288 RepID=A0A345YM29_9MICO|nr:nucleotide pyrophosphatase/phosphodiesterase family protein [Brachybacterium saurashtrense]AXK44981.1 alkaline phosphatase family protein [Brachybacterium saurashtrense]RRR21665.1 alkaline phosphatase family protein [Brachybacterium saurashtrense]